MAALITHKLKISLAVAWWMLAACRSASDAEASRELSAHAVTVVSQVKPATAPAANESETLEPNTETAEIPRGVSAPAPRPADERSEQAQQPAHQAKPAHERVDGLKTVGTGNAKQATAPTRAEPALPKPTATKRAAKPVASKPPLAAREPAASAEPEPPVPQEPIAPAPPAPPPPAAKASVTVPHTDHVHVDVPAGLQHWLDEDDRMKPWLSKAISVADACYAKVREDDTNASGAITMALTMHENARPSGKVSSITGALNSIVMCATTRLLGIKMPLFTGTEGDAYTVRVHFDP